MSRRSKVVTEQDELFGDIEVEKSGFKSLYGTGMIENQKVILCKTLTLAL